MQDQNGSKATERRGVPPSTRNSHKSNFFERFMHEDLDQRHPGEALFNPENLRDLVIKSDITERMQGVLWKMLFIAERYKITALQEMVEWYLLTRLPINRQARKEYSEVVIGLKKMEDDELERKL